MYRILHTDKTKQADMKLPFVARFRYIVAAMFLIRRMENVVGRVHDVGEGCSIPVFLNRRAATRYRSLTSITPDREKFSWNLSF